MEFLDIYDEDGNHIGQEERGVVHKEALWHKTVHCWLFDDEGYVYFQIRKDEGTLYTTASGHIQAGETVEEGFAREIFEEIGYKLDYKQAKKLDEFKFVFDKIKKNGSVFRDRAMANIFAYQFDKDLKKLNFDANELNGLVKVKAKDALELFKKENGQIDGFEIKFDGKTNVMSRRVVDFFDFLVNQGETAIGKYGKVLEGILGLLKYW